MSESQTFDESSEKERKRLRVSARVANPPLHHPTLFLSPSQSWVTPVIREGDGGGE